LISPARRAVPGQVEIRGHSSGTCQKIAARSFRPPITPTRAPRPARSGSDVPGLIPGETTRSSVAALRLRAIANGSSCPPAKNRLACVRITWDQQRQPYVFVRRMRSRPDSDLRLREGDGGKVASPPTRLPMPRPPKSVPISRRILLFLMCWQRLARCGRLYGTRRAPKLRAGGAWIVGATSTARRPDRLAGAR